MVVGARIGIVIALSSTLGCSAISGLSGLDFDGGGGDGKSSSGGRGGNGAGGGDATGGAPANGSSSSTGGPSSCNDGKKDGDETDVDCGGHCPACPLGDACKVEADCATPGCVDGYCQTAPVGVWEQLMPLADDPADRYGCVMAWDGTTIRLLQGIHGSGQVSGAKTYLWGVMTWTSMSTEPPAFEARYRAMIAAGDAGLLIYGGGETPTIALGDSWTLATGAPVWQETTGGGPPPRASGAMAAGTTAALLFGGTPDSTTPLGDTWQFGPGGWSVLHPTMPPPARYQASMAFDSAHNQEVLFGGIGASGTLGDYWLFDGANWIPGTAPPPPARSGAAMVFDATRNRTVLFTGESGASTFLSDTWEWDGSRWVMTANDTPELAEGCAAYDPSRRRILLYGGRTSSLVLSNTWQYHAHGNACRSAAACDTNQCVDGLCCEQASCGMCSRCNDPTAPGVCTPCATCDKNGKCL